MPRPTWLTILLIGVPTSGDLKFFAAGSSLFAEVILQFLSAYYLLMTVHYGRKHHFYLGMDGAERGGPAKTMYAGALLWLIIVSVVIAQLIRAIRMNRLTGPGFDTPEWQGGKQTTSKIKDLMGHLDECCTRLMESRGSEETSLIKSRGDHTDYGACSVEGQHDRVSQKSFVGLYAATVISMLLLWIAQWLFWGGFIGLSSEEYVLHSHYLVHIN